MSTEELLKEAAALKEEIVAAREGRSSCLGMLPSYLPLPQGDEAGEFLALDFGGSNIRVARVALSNKNAAVIRQETKPLARLSGEGPLDSDRLFARIASFIHSFAGTGGGFLGHTFSYPVQQSGSNSARLKEWTKEAAFASDQDFDINATLYRHLCQLGRADIRPAVLLNDTTAVLLDAVYRGNVRAGIGSICGTGHNSCYYEPDTGMVVNMEIGNYRPLSRNAFDKRLDESSRYPGRQGLEKMTAGKYLAELVCLAAAAAGMPGMNINATAELATYLETACALRPLVEAVLQRAAGLLAAEYKGIAMYLQTKGLSVDGIAIDGAVYNGLPFFQQELYNALGGLFDHPPRLYKSEGASISGAAVAVAISIAQGWTSC